MDLDIWAAREVARLLTLVENERRYYQEILSAVPVAVAVVAPTLQFLSFNRAFGKLFDLTAAEVAHKRLDDVVGPEFARRVIADALASAVPETTVETVVEGGGAVSRKVQLTIAPIRGGRSEQGVDLLLVAREAPEAAGLGDDALERLGVALWEHDLETGRITFLNRYGAELAGAAGVAGWRERVDPEDQDRVSLVHASAAESGERAVVEYTARRPGGARAWFRDSILPVGEPGRGASRLRVATTDETERQARSLAAAQRLQVEAMSRLANLLAHDVNNILMIVQGYSEDLAERFPAGDPARESLEEIIHASERLGGLTQQMLRFGKPASTQRETIDLNRFVRELNLPVVTRLAPESYPVSVDGKLLRAGLDMLVGRPAAGTAVPVVLATGAEMEVSDFGLSDPRGQVYTLRVGPLGMAASGRGQWWEMPGPRPAEEFEPKAVAFSVLTQAGASVTYVEEGGAAFFDLRFEACAPAGVSEVSPVAPGAAEAMGTRERVLVVDDEASIRTLIVRILRRQGYEVVEASGREEALAQCRREPALSMVVSDVILPGTSGPELVREMRAVRPALRALYVSGYADDPQLSAGALGPGEGFLQKPFTLSALAEAVRSVLDAPPPESGSGERKSASP